MSIDEIRRRHAKATRGPWIHVAGYGRYRPANDGSEQPMGKSVYSTTAIEPDRRLGRKAENRFRTRARNNGYGLEIAEVRTMGDHDGEFIAHAWADILALMEMIDALILDGVGESADPLSPLQRRALAHVESFRDSPHVNGRYFAVKDAIRLADEIGLAREDLPAVMEAAGYRVESPFLWRLDTAARKPRQ